ncbi:MAG: sulfite exporter TauE/SafE family protein [Syntrophobacteraceae bacterium]
MVRIQIGFALVAATVLVWFGLARLKVIAEPSWMLLARPDVIPGSGGVLRYALAKKTHFGMFLAGLLFGLLPCGISYAAFALALPSGGAVQGGLLLAAFAAGTLPALLIVGSGASGLARHYSRQADLLSGVLMIFMAVSLTAHQISRIFFR